MKNLVKADRQAIQFLAFFIRPIGLLIMLALVQIVEGGGIAIFFSELVIEKTSGYIADLHKIAPGIKAKQIIYMISIGAGMFLSLTAVVAILALRLIDSNGIATVFSILFAILSFTTYYNIIDVEFSIAIFNNMSKFWRIIGITAIVIMCSALASRISGKLSEYVKNSKVFKELVQAIDKQLEEGWETDTEEQIIPSDSDYSSRLKNL